MKAKQNIHLITNQSLYTYAGWCLYLFIIYFYFRLFVGEDDKIYYWGNPCTLVLFSILSFYLTYFFVAKWLNRRNLRSFFKYLFFFVLWLMVNSMTFGIYLEWIAPRTGLIDFFELLYMGVVYMIPLMPLIIVHYPVYLLVLVTGFITLYINKTFYKKIVK